MQVSLMDRQSNQSVENSYTQSLDKKENIKSDNERQNGPERDVLDFIKSNPGYQPSIAEKNIKDAIEKTNRKLQGVNTEVEFSVHEQTNEIMVKVVNAETKEIIREIPPKKILDMVAKMWELAGLIVDEKR